MKLLFRRYFSEIGVASFIFFLGFSVASVRVPLKVERVSARESSALALSLVNPSNGTSLTQADPFQSLDQRRAEMLTAQEKRLQNDNLAEFRKNQDREYQLRKEEIMAYRKTCNKQADTFTKDRKAQRESLRKSCMTTKPLKRSMSASEASELRKVQQQQNAECVSRLKSFDTDTRVQLVTLRKSCYDTERGVLGLSTETPSE